MEIKHIDDAKGKNQSHEIHTETHESSWAGHYNLEVVAYGASKEEAETNAKAQLQAAIRSLTSAIARHLNR